MAMVESGRHATKVGDTLDVTAMMPILLLQWGQDLRKASFYATAHNPDTALEFILQHDEQNSKNPLSNPPELNKSTLVFYK
eukprot:2822378-Amphidinium_carterae.1